MSEGAPTKRLPKWVEPRKLAASGARFHRVLESDDLTRLSEATHSIESVQLDLEFSYDEQGRPRLAGQIDAELALQCQSCLGPMPFSLHCELNVAMAWDEKQAKALPSYIDPWIVGDGEADLHAIVEEEILLQLPVIARHEPACLSSDELSFGETVTEEPERSNPFDVLAQLKKSDD